jgi:hypothetical protein
MRDRAVTAQNPFGLAVEPEVKRCKQGRPLPVNFTGAAGLSLQQVRYFFFAYGRSTYSESPSAGKIPQVAGQGACACILSQPFGRAMRT